MATSAIVPQSPPPSSTASPSSPDRRSKEIPPPLSLTIDGPRHSSPFPSPSSSFVPPPMPGAHEFANKPPARFLRRKKSGSPSKGPDELSSPKKSDPPSKETPREPMNGAAVPMLNTDVLSAKPLAATTPITPTPGSLAITPTAKSTPITIPHLDTTNDDRPPSSPAAESPSNGRNTPTPTHIALPSPPPPPPDSPSQQAFSAVVAAATPAPTPLRTPSSSGTASKHTSLSSSRPAPASPSPAPSRRQSGAPSRRSGLSTTSTTSSSGAANNKTGTIKASPSSAAAFQQQPAGAGFTRRRGEVRICDFAFPASDVRHKGRGPDAPKVIKRLVKRHGSDAASSRRASGISESSVDSEEGGGSSSRRSSGFGGWGAFRWASRFGGPWGFGASGGAAGASSSSSGSGGNGRASGSASAPGGGYVPSQQDFERNFDDEDDDDAVGSAEDDEEDGEYFSDYEHEGGADGESEELLPGLYRALYDFEPEGTAEMGLKEGQTVKVVGRGGGVGWAIAVRPGAAADEGGEANWALVPESYLRVVRLDENIEAGGASLDDEPEVSERAAGDVGD